MIYKFIENKISYDGSQLKPLYAYLHHGVKGDSILSFVGPCNVAFEHMVDAEDLLENSPIKSDLMLHFIIEIFPANVLSAVVLQRLFASQVAEQVRKVEPKIHRIGDDLYLGKKKLSISIASVSPVSSMIHFAVNITNEGTPVETLSLLDLGLDPASFSNHCAAQFVSEFVSIVDATKKVKPLY